MKHLLLVLALTGFLPLTGEAIPNLNTTESERKKAIAELFQDAQHLSALSTADRFLAAWVSGEDGTAESLMSPSYKGSSDDLESFLASACPCAFEIKHGKRIRPGAYEFPVVLLRPPAGNSRISVQSSTIFVSRDRDDRWLVEKLP
jgi:hypothetical protein